MTWPSPELEATISARNTTRSDTVTASRNPVRICGNAPGNTTRERIPKLESPMLQQIDVQWSDPSAESWPARVPHLYLGEPLVLPPAGPDEEWIPAPSETPSDVSLGAIA